MAVGDIAAKAEKKVRVLLCEDHQVLADALSMLIGTDDRLESVTDPVATAEAAIAAVTAHAPDVVLMDVELPGPMNGVQATAVIRKISPATKVVVMSGGTDPAQLLVDAVEAGASGFLPKTEAASTMLAAIRAAASGDLLMDAETLARVMRGVAAGRTDRRDLEFRTGRLTGRERQVLQQVADGKSNDQIAALLHISALTVQTHLRNAFTKLGVHSKLEAVTVLVKAGVVQVDQRSR